MKHNHRIYRDTRRRWIGGVCAGFADHLGVPVFFIRLLALMLLVTPVAPLAVIIYLFLLFRIPKRPTPPPSESEAEDFRRQVTHAPAATFGQVRHRMRELEHRIRRLEAYVTSTEFKFNQSFSGKAR